MRFAPRCAIVLACVADSHAASAQALPPSDLPPSGDAGQILRQAEQAPPYKDSAQEDMSLSLPQDSAAAPAQDMEFEISGFVLEGVSQPAWAQTLQQLLQPYVSSKGTLTQVQAATQIISTWYRARGYILARAYVPPQNISRGVVRLVVQEGYVDPDAPVLVVRSPQSHSPRFRKSLAAAFMSDAVEGDRPVQRARVESALIGLNALSGVKAQVQFQPGSQSGTTRLSLQIQDKPLLSVYGAYDTHGAILTGRQRVHTGLALQNPSGYGDELRAQISTTRENYLYGHVAYRLPIGPSGFTLGGGYGYLRYGIGGKWALLQAGGRAQSWDVQARWALVQQRLQSFVVEGGYQQDRLRNHLAGFTTSDRSLSLWRIGVQAMQAHGFNGGGQWTVGLEARAAKLDLSALPMILAADQGPWGAHMHGPFRTLQWQARIYQTLWPAAGLALELEGEGQWANRILDSAAKFQLGGPEAVRAYPSGEGAGDQGWRGRANVHWYWAQNEGPLHQTLRLSGYYDHGVAKPYQLMPGQAPMARHHVAGWGISLMASWSRHVFFSLHHARAIGSNAFADAQGLDSEGLRTRARNWLSVSVVM